MIITKTQANKLCNLNKATPVAVVAQDGKRFVAISRHDIQRTDHYQVSDAEADMIVASLDKCAA